MKRLVGVAMALCAVAVQAQYKVVGPDGKITYTDRPPAAAQGRVAPLGPTGASPAPAAEAALPYALREVATRFPVTLYTTADCPPCDQGRALLRQRGVPYRERTASTDADRAAWPQAVGGRDAPALSVGGERLNGFSASGWNEVLDTAGYPKESRLPPNYVPPPPAPLVAARPAPAPPPELPRPVAPEAPFAPASGIRF